MNRDRKVVISIIGSSSVGKTTLIERFSPVCPFCSMLAAYKQIKEQSGESNQDDDNLEEKSKEVAKKQSHWGFGKLQSPKSLKWYCRHTLLNHGISFLNANFPRELYEYVTEARCIFCDKCQQLYTQYLEKTTQPVFFDKSLTFNNIMYDLTILDSAGWNEMTNRNKHILLQFVSGIIFVYDVTSKSSFHLIEELLAFLEQSRNSENSPKPTTAQNPSQEDPDNIPIIDPNKPLTPIYSVVGMKSESPYREVTLEEGEKLAEKYNAFHTECSFIVQLPKRTVSNNNNLPTQSETEEMGMWNRTSDFIFEDITQRILQARKPPPTKTWCCVQ